MVLDDGAADRQADPQAVGLGGVERGEQLRALGLAEARAAVADPHFDLAVEIDPALDAQTASRRGHLAHGFDRVLDQVQQHLFDHHPVRVDLRQPRGEGQFDPQLLALGFLALPLGFLAAALLVLVVVGTDVFGYFAGRIIGGPKFWPSLSPKKTWSGTVAGWIGALLLGVLLWRLGRGDAMLIWCSPIVCLAGQMGDIAESWLKRRAGVKDSSNLIPGHGGFMDRFDAVTGAVLATMLIGLLTALPSVN